MKPSLILPFTFSLPKEISAPFFPSCPTHSPNLHQRKWLLGLAIPAHSSASFQLLFQSSASLLSLISNCLFFEKRKFLLPCFCFSVSYLRSVSPNPLPQLSALTAWWSPLWNYFLKLLISMWFIIYYLLSLSYAYYLSWHRESSFREWLQQPGLNQEQVSHTSGKNSTIWFVMHWFSWYNQGAGSEAEQQGLQLMFQSGPVLDACITSAGLLHCTTMLDPILEFIITWVCFTVDSKLLEDENAVF